MAEFYVERQGWKHWPKVLVMCRKNGRDVTHRRYVPEVEMGEGMSITKELREWWARKFPVMDEELHKDFTAIADRIDGRVTELLRKQDADLRAELDAMNDGWVRLPVDADGVPWRLGDELMMEGEACEVVGFGGKTVFYAFGDGVEWTIAHNNRHYHAPTVEDMLREFANRWWTLPREESADELLADYAKRLQLREDA